MKRAIILTAACLLAISCSSKKKEQDRERELMNSPDWNPPQVQTPVEEHPAPRQIIMSVTLTPEIPTIKDEITATPTLERPVEGVEFVYQWFVNDKEVTGATMNKLDPGFFKKKDWLFCMVTAVRGQEQSESFRSDTIQIINQKPVIEPGAQQSFRFPGLYTCQVRAVDADGDALYYELVSPTNLGISINPGTGLIQWNITRDMLSTLPNSLEIRYRVSDADGGEAIGFVNLNLPRY